MDDFKPIDTFAAARLGLFVHFGQFSPLSKGEGR